MSGSESDEGKTVGYFRQLHVELLAVLVIVFVVLVIVGWQLRPSSAGFPPVDDRLVLFYSGPMLTSEFENITLTPGGGSTLGVSVNFPQGATGSWALAIPGLTKKNFCGEPVVGARPQVNDRPNGSSTELVVHGTGPLILNFCWPTGGVADIEGAYLSAVFPTFQSDENGGALGYSPSYDLSGPGVLGTDRDWIFQSQAPASRGGQEVFWSWPSDVGPHFSVAAVNTNTSQHDDNLSFLSGVLLGVAAGALISILAELVAPFSRRRDDRTDSAPRQTP